MRSTRSWILPLALLTWSGACLVSPERNESAAIDGDAVRGALLFRQQCAVCHGAEGRGDGVASSFLFPPARDFGRGEFRLVGNSRRVPSELDLIETLRRGMPGSAMPSWDWMPQEDLEALAVHVHNLAVDGLRDGILEGAHPEEEDLDLQEAVLLARERLTPGSRLPAPASFPDSAEKRQRGWDLYMANCAPCHGEQGRGTALPTRLAGGDFNWPRDFTAGYMKGGASRRELAARIQFGIPGTVMPALELPASDLDALIEHVRGMIPEGSEDYLVQHRRRLVVRKQADPLPDSMEAFDWSDADVVPMSLAPLWWKGDDVLQASISAMSDGQAVAFRILWADQTGGEGTLGNEPARDAVALQFSDSESPALFGMEANGPPRNLWHWKSRRAIELAGELDALGMHSAGTAVGSDGYSYHLAEGSAATSTRVDRVRVQGLANAANMEREESDVRVHARWEKGTWEVVFVRSLAANDEAGLDFRTRAPLQFSLSIWNGATGLEPSDKSISIWHDLEF